MDKRLSDALDSLRGTGRLPFQTSARRLRIKDRVRIIAIAGLLSMPLLSWAQPTDTKDLTATDKATKNQTEAPSTGTSRGRTRSSHARPGSRQRLLPTDRFDPNQRGGLTPVAPRNEDAPPLSDVIKDRWRLVNQLGIVKSRWYDPYHLNPLKGDQPVYGKDWFFQLNLISDTIVEPRSLPVPVGGQTTLNPGGLDVFGDGDQLIFNQNLIIGLVYLKGDTTFRPPDYEFRLTPVINYNYVETQERRLLRIDPRTGTARNDAQVLLQEAFFDYHIRNVSDRFDFDSFRIGIQPFSTDFRGFLFQDLQLGMRLFGNRDNNIFQYNLAWFRRLEKDLNSGLNDIRQDIRKDDVFIANLYWQDFPQLGFMSQATVVYNRNREGNQPSFFDENGFIQRPASLGNERPRNYDVVYLGYNGDGHFGRLNLTVSSYLALGREDSQTFVDRAASIRAGFFAAEAGMDFDWIRLRASGVFASADSDPFDDVSGGFDAIFENPIIGGYDTNYWTHQNVPLVAGGGVAITPRNGMLNSLRSSKEQGQSNFTNPGTALLGLGADLDLSPELRLSFNANALSFVDSTVLEVARNQSNIDRFIGVDLSVATIWRPLMSQNIVARLSGAVLLPGQGFADLFPNKTHYSIFANLVLSY